MSLDRYDTTGVIEGGKLRVRHQQAFAAAMRQLPEGEVIVSIRHARATRSAAQNRTYWRFYVAPLAEYTGYSPLWIHSYLKQRFLTAPQILITDANGEVVDEATIEPTTTTLTKVEFGEYLNHIAEFAESLDVVVGLPVDEWEASLAR